MNFRKALVSILIYMGIITLTVMGVALLDFFQFGAYKPSISKSVLTSILALSMYDNMNLKIDVVKRPWGTEE